MRTVLEERGEWTERPGLLERRWFIGLLLILLLIALACAVLLVMYPDVLDRIIGGGKPKPPPLPKTSFNMIGEYFRWGV
ncbi:TPA: hypothetical protein EYP37_06800 [Candidatus Poribacteria bacterium]|nr:hypothetical protein [Candidatus Poribacteria bacterium]